METLAPPLELMIEVRFSIEKGLSVKKSAQIAASKASDAEWKRVLHLWLSLIEMGRSTSAMKAKLSLARRQSLDILEQGMAGESIYSQVCSLEQEFLEAAHLEMEHYVATLPIKSLIPLLFFQFPSFLLLLIGPFLQQFLSQS